MRSAPPGVWATTVRRRARRRAPRRPGTRWRACRWSDRIRTCRRWCRSPPRRVVLVNDGHAAAEADRVGADLALVHDDGVLDHGLQLGNALFEHSLIVLRRVVFGVLAQVAVGNRNLELLGDLHFFGSLFVFKLFLHALKAFAGNNHMLGVGHRSSLFFLARCRAKNEAPGMFASGHTAIFYDYTLRAPVCQSTRTRKMQAVTKKTANSLTSGRRRAIIRGTAAGFALFSPAQSDHDARHGRLFSLQVFQRLAKHECDDTCAGYHKQKVRHGSHLLPVKFRGWNGVKPAAVHRKDFRPLHSITDNVVCQSVVCFDSIFCRHRAASAVDISKIDLNSKIKKFSHSFICGKGYSPFGGRIAFSTVCCRHRAAFYVRQ